MNLSPRCTTKYGLHYYSLLFLLLAATALTPTVTAQEIKKGCSKSPKVVSQPKLPEADGEKAKRLHNKGEGKVVIPVNEAGEVTQVKVLSASPKESADLLCDLAKSMRFAARPGCGDLRIETYFTSLR